MFVGVDPDDQKRQLMSKLGQFLTSVATSLLVSLAVYYFLVPSVHEAQLKLTSLFVDGTYTFDNGTEYWSTSVENHGPLALPNVTLSFRGTALAKASASVTVDPPIPGHPEQSGDAMIIPLGTMAPRSRLIVKVGVRPDPNSTNLMMSAGGRYYTVIGDINGWAFSDATPQTPIPWRYGGSTISGNFTIGVAPATKKGQKKRDAGTK